MSQFTHLVGSRTYIFADLRELLAKASPARSGDFLAGVAAGSAEERVAAQMALAALPLTTFLNEAVVPYELDEVTRLILDTHDAAAFAPIRHLTVGDFRDWLLGDEADEAALARIAPGITPEMAAAVSKIMRIQDLVLAARKCRVVTRFRSTIGLAGTLSTRLQPNHPLDDASGIAASLFDGLMYGSGDAVIGINPATDNLAASGELLRLLDEVIRRHDIPTQGCVLTHVSNTLRLIEQGVPVDLVFQSVAGTQKANAGFGVTLAVLREAQAAALSLQRGTVAATSCTSRPARARRFRPTPTMAWTSRRWKRVPMAWHGPLRRCSPTPWSVSSDPSTSTTANRSSAPAWKTTSAASCWAYRWAATSATPTMPKPTATTWTR